MDAGKKPKPALPRSRRSTNGGAPPRIPGAPSTPPLNSHVGAAPPAPPITQGNVQRESPGPSPAGGLGGRPSRTPLLMLPERAGGTVRTFYNLSRGRAVDVDLPEMANHLCYACSHGWVMAGNCLTGECFLLDPLTRTRRELPGVSVCTRTPHAALSSAPTDPGCVVALAFPGTLILCRPGATNWSVHRLEDYDHDVWLGDCAFCRGALYLVCGGGTRLLIVEAAAAEGSPAVRRVEMDAVQLPSEAPGCRRLGFLVQSLGELLLVVVTEAEGALTCGVFRADLERYAWEPVEGLGDRALLVGKGCSASVAAGVAGDGGIRAGRVYISHPLLLGDEESRRQEAVHGRWFWAEHVVGLDCPPMKRAPLLRHRDLCWDASYWLVPGTPVSSSSSSPPPSPLPPGVQV